MMIKRNKGFTLIELLVVISIIGVLSSIVLSSLTSARMKARDARRKSDLSQILTALNLFYDTNGCLPITVGTTCSGAAGYSDANTGGWDYSSVGGFMPFLQTGGFMATVPVDPINNGTGDVFFFGTGYAYAYYCYDSNNTMTLGAKLESTGGVYYRPLTVSGFRCS